MAKHPMPFNNPYTYPGHGGIDYAQRPGTPIRAIADGQITFSGWWNGRAGNTRTLTDRNGLQIVHCHLQNLNGPAIGRWVKEGDIIGYVGWTGRVFPANANGSHLHQELYWKGKLQSGSLYWNWIDRNSVVGAAPAGGGSTVTPAIPTPSQEEDMAIIIVQKKDPQAAKGQLTHNRKIRLISRAENNAYRSAQNQDRSSVIYVTVSDSDFNELLAGK